MSEFWGSWGRTPGTDRLLMGLERLNGFSLQEVKGSESDNLIKVREVRTEVMC